MNAQAPNPFSKTDLISPKTFRRMSPDRPFEMTELIDSPFRTEGTLRRNVVLNSAMLEQSKAFTRPGRWLLFRCLRNVLVVSFLSDGRFDDLVRLDGGIGALRVDPLQRVDDIHSLNDMAENRMFAVQPRRLGKRD